MEVGGCGMLDGCRDKEEGGLLEGKVREWGGRCEDCLFSGRIYRMEGVVVVERLGVVER